MEAVGSGVPDLKVSGFCRRRTNNCPELSLHRMRAFTCNAISTFPCFGEDSQRSKQPLEIVSVSHHASADSSGNFTKLSFQAPIKNRHLVGKTFFSKEACAFDEKVMGMPLGIAQDKVGVLLLNLGGPETLHDVQPFLFNLFADPDIIRLPRLFRFLQRPLAQLISMLRAPKSKEGYAAIGGGSPLRRITDEQAHALKLALEEKNLHANVYVAMRYWHPFTEDAIHLESRIVFLFLGNLFSGIIGEDDKLVTITTSQFLQTKHGPKIKKDNITKLVILPLYPQFSISTSGSSIRRLQGIFREDAYFARLPVSIIESWYQREGYIKSMADLIGKELLGFSKPEEVMIFFSAHGVPLSYVEDAGDPYKDQMEECIALIMDELKSRGIANHHTLAYQSRVGPIQWLKPYTDEVIVELGQKGVKSLMVVPISFVSEHIETLEEIDMEYKHLALQSGIENWGRVPALGCTSSFISDLADAVIEALPFASNMSSAKDTSKDADMDPVQYAIKMFFGSILAFILLLSPKLFSAFKNSVI